MYVIKCFSSTLIFWTEALDSMSIVYDTDWMFLIQVLQTFSWEIIIRCPACRFRLIDILWNVPDCFGLVQVAKFFVYGPTHLLIEHQEQRMEEKRLQQRAYLLLEKITSREVAGEVSDAVKTNNSFTSIATINAELIVVRKENNKTK